MSTPFITTSMTDDYFESDAAAAALLNSEWFFLLASDSHTAPTAEPQSNSEDAP